MGICWFHYPAKEAKLTIRKGFAVPFVGEVNAKFGKESIMNVTDSTAVEVLSPQRFGEGGRHLYCCFGRLS